MASSLK
jgi:hypothetical protein